MMLTLPGRIVKVQPGKGVNVEEQPICDFTGECEAPYGVSRIANCIHCGKELHEKDGKWWTWDVDLFPNSKPQRQAGRPWGL
jgi:hypothetical protein